MVLRKNIYIKRSVHKQCVKCQGFSPTSLIGRGSEDCHHKQSHFAQITARQPMICWSCCKTWTSREANPKDFEDRGRKHERPMNQISVNIENCLVAQEFRTTNAVAVQFPTFQASVTSVGKIHPYIYIYICLHIYVYIMYICIYIYN